ncbi:Cell surface protein [Pelomyxa schiedti]|nr:Cell surface protein [Pelomyxa schiedti]
MVFSFGDGTISCYDSTATHKWTWDFATYCGINPQVHAIEGSEPALVDLNADGIAEVIFVTWGYPTDPPSAENNQHLFILSNTGTLLHDVPLNTAAAGGGDTSFNGNGNGPCATPTVADLDGDGDLEIVIHTFDGRMLIYTVPGSATNCMLWPTGRGGYMRKGQPDVYYP